MAGVGGHFSVCVGHCCTRSNFGQQVNASRNSVYVCIARSYSDRRTYCPLLQNRRKTPLAMGSTRKEIITSLMRRIGHIRLIGPM